MMTKEEYDKRMDELVYEREEAFANGFYGRADRILEKMIDLVDKQKRSRV
ncbi:hypothetical protein PPISBEST_196 [Bacillus phage PPIsBest]|uniref:Uncharacterized protein n=3 Tax=Wphvirus TaxID=1922327 RepID=A0A222Z2I6_9CAUD|nr:hypothetical protein BIZ89_gp199 [Bacillus phage Kida]YP_009280998.1 hypothetical protein SAGEFAYGE_195 [Bacillus phage SageFayge]ASR78264.1 hypothetical protein PPISBEST_196 [Bacillus phage PPIsBest]QDH50178.1 hypothetical protein ALPS_192 [Bacillus phage ALPS]AMW63115.1 hypothetical protein SAGEFAYGE_195 [Bacillus phage SageFayge]ANU79901.1 hypothetical protein KIDA_200 [Bacillus phage Kida]